MGANTNLPRIVGTGAGRGRGLPVKAPHLNPGRDSHFGWIAAPARTLVISVIFGRTAAGQLLPADILRSSSWDVPAGPSSLPMSSFHLQIHLLSVRMEKEAVPPALAQPGLVHSPRLIASWNSL